MRRFVLLLVAMTMCVVARPAHAQTPTALTITVTDADGKAVEGVEVTLQDEATATHTTMTGADGDATVTGLPGTMVLLVEATLHGQPLLFPSTMLSHTLELPLRVGETQHLPLSLTGRTLAFLPPTLRPAEAPTQAAVFAAAQPSVGQGGEALDQGVPPATSPIRRGIQVLTLLVWGLILVPGVVYCVWWLVVLLRSRRPPSPPSSKGRKV